MMAMAAGGAAVLVFSGKVARAEADAAQEEAAVLVVIDRWYRALRERDGAAMSRLLGPMAIVEKDLWRCRDPLSRACDLIFAPDLLAFGALRFSEEIRQTEVEGRLARVSVLVRAWFPSQQGDYQRAAVDDFYLRRWPDKGWLVAVAGERTTALP